MILRGVRTQGSASPFSSDNGTCPLALKILDGEVLHGDHVVADADLKTRKMTFAVSRAAQKAAGREKRTAEASRKRSAG